MKPCYFLLLLQSLAFPLLAQFTDDFSAATLADHWQGETDKFRIRTGELQLFNDGSSGGTTVLYATVPTSTAAETTWRLQLRNEFAPSSSNFATVYLVVNQPPVPDSPLEGYYLKIGGVSGTVDRVQLYRQDGNSSELLLEGDEGAVGDNPVLLGVEVRRTTAGEWSLQMDYSGGTDYDPQGGTTIDNTYPEGLYFGLSCDYTSTRDTSFFFDNIFVAPVVVDEAAPVAESVTATGPNELTVQVNEPLSSAVLIAANYTVNNGIGTAQSVNFENGDPTRLVLSFSNSFVNLTNYELQISSLVDLAENASGLQVLNFEFLLPELAAPGDLIFTEIFADPTPSLGLPDFEYVEIYNASDKVINLLGYGLSTGATPRIIDDYLLLPNSYVTLCDRDAADDLSAFGPVATLASFPALTNGGDDLILLAENTVISELTYSIDWFVDPVKAAGGYSLELIDPSVSGACPGNWRGSESGNGGTPGTQNSLFGAALETDPPLLLTAFAATSTEIVLQFDDVVADNPDLVDLFSLSPGVSIGAALLENNDQNIRLFLGGDLTEGVVYDLNLAAGISDCLGNVSTIVQTLQLGLTQAPEPGDLLLSEILFNPYSGGTDFVELYNVSDKILNLNGIQFRNDSITSGDFSGTVAQDVIVFPQQYVAFSEAPVEVLSRYIVPNPVALVANDLPSLGDNEGNISVYSANFEPLDALDYTRDWHSSLLSSRDGVSLERLRFEQPTQNQGNWASAASVVGFATPTGPNSQARATVAEPTDKFFSIPETTFSPDDDGFQDVLEIQYTTDQAGYAAQLYIFDAQGRPINQLFRLELLAGQGSFLWDGSTFEGRRARVGIYVLVAELFTPAGTTIREKHTIVLAGRLD